MCVCFTGKKLSDLERVTSLKVYNWFANRRKDIKRRANIGNVYVCICVCVCVGVKERYTLDVVYYTMVWCK